MEEAERLCDRIIIIDHGKVIANDTLHGLHRMLPVTNVMAIELESPNGFKPDPLLALPEVVSAELREGVLRVGIHELTAGAPAILRWLAENGHSYQHVTSERPDLETVFLTLTGRSLRDS
jgi:ABC-2 type transport system ATP-binding protein